MFEHDFKLMNEHDLKKNKPQIIQKNKSPNLKKPPIGGIVWETFLYIFWGKYRGAIFVFFKVILK
jgi:hypothetical protein